MKKSFAILTFIFLFKIMSGQDTLKRFEFGSTLITADLYNPSYPTPTFQYINGVFFRFTKKRIGLRLHASYSDYTMSFKSTLKSVDGTYFFGQTTNYKDFKLGVGGQFSILKRRDRLYSFLDISYRNVFTTGYEFGPSDETFSSTSNGFDGFAGVGFKMKVLNYFYLSPEFGCYSSSQFVKKTTTSANVYSFTTGQLVSKKESYSVTAISPVIKLHLTIKF